MGQTRSPSFSGLEDDLTSQVGTSGLRHDDAVGQSFDCCGIDLVAFDQALNRVAGELQRPHVFKGFSGLHERGSSPGDNRHASLAHIISNAQFG